MELDTDSPRGGGRCEGGRVSPLEIFFAKLGLSPGYPEGDPYHHLRAGIGGTTAGYQVGHISRGKLRRTGFGWEYPEVLSEGLNEDMCPRTMPRRHGTYLWDGVAHPIVRRVAGGAMSRCSSQWAPHLFIVGKTVFVNAVKEGEGLRSTVVHYRVQI